MTTVDPGDAEAMPGRYVSESYTEQVCVVMPQHLNGYGKLFGGQLAAWIDLLAGVVATRHCRMKITTAAIDNLTFREGAGLSSVIVLRGRMTYTGRTSMEVRVDSYNEDVRTGEHRLINTAFVTQVALDEEDRPRLVPVLIPITEQEKRYFRDGQRRREFRNSRRDLFQ